jgi:transposase InsO family protein
MVVDVFSRKIVGASVHESESGEYASALLRTACANDGLAATPNVLHSDNGGVMKGATLLATLQELGIATSFSRPRVSDDNPFSEALFRTCKYRPDYPYKGFAALEDARAWVLKFVNWYNHDHKHSGLKFMTPHQRHTGQTDRVIGNRKTVYEAARAANPRRWSQGIRDWDLPEKVWLNPEKDRGDLEAAA